MQISPYLVSSRNAIPEHHCAMITTHHFRIGICSTVDRYMLSNSHFISHSKSVKIRGSSSVSRKDSITGRYLHIALILFCLGYRSLHGFIHTPGFTLLQLYLYFRAESIGMGIFSIQLIVKNQFVCISHVVGMAYSKIHSFAGSCSAKSERADIWNFILVKGHHRIVDGSGAKFPTEHTGTGRHAVVRGSRIIKVTIRSRKIHSSGF